MALASTGTLLRNINGSLTLTGDSVPTIRLDSLVLASGEARDSRAFLSGTVRFAESPDNACAVISLVECLARRSAFDVMFRANNFEAIRQRRIADLLGTLAPTTVPLADARGLVLAEPVTAPEALPSFDNSAMDGYAVRAADVSPELWQVSIPQTYKGIPVRYGRLAASLNNGNLVVIGTETWGDVRGLSHIPKLKNQHDIYRVLARQVNTVSAFTEPTSYICYLGLVLSFTWQQGHHNSSLINPCLKYTLQILQYNPVTYGECCGMQLRASPHCGRVYREKVRAKKNELIDHKRVYQIGSTG